MATFNTIIDDARYDLRDYQTGLEFDDEELLNFVNRMIRLLESTLTSLNSDLVHGVSPLILADDVYSLGMDKSNWKSYLWTNFILYDKVHLPKKGHLFIGHSKMMIFSLIRSLTKPILLLVTTTNASEL
jgi:hypothetical protein